MSEQGNFIITVIIITLGLITSIFYILTNIEPNIYWVAGFIALAGTTIIFIFSLLFFVFSKLRSFETPKELYRRQLKKAAIVGLIGIALLLAQKFFDLL